MRMKLATNQPICPTNEIDNANAINRCAYGIIVSFLSLFVEPMIDEKNKFNQCNERKRFAFSYTTHVMLNAGATLSKFGVRPL